MSGFVENRLPAFWILSTILGLIVVAILSLTLTPLGKNLLDRFNEQFSEEYIARKSVDYLVATDGLEETLKIIYSDFETPDQIFGPLWLQSVTVDGAKVTLRHQYREAFDDVSDVFVPDDDHSISAVFHSTSSYWPMGRCSQTLISMPIIPQSALSP